MNDKTAIVSEYYFLFYKLDVFVFGMDLVVSVNTRLLFTICFCLRRLIY